VGHPTPGPCGRVGWVVAAALITLLGTVLGCAGRVARAEGEIVIWGPQGVPMRDVLVSDFQRRHPEMRVDFSGMQSSQVAAKLFPEQQAGMHRVDLIVAGSATIIADLLPGGALEPIRPYLVGPDARDESKWLDGKLEFADDAGQYDLVFASGVKLPIVYNPRSVSPHELRSYQALVDPKWRGKLTMLDPRSPGAGQATATFFYFHPKLGPGFVRQLLANGVVLSKDDRQILNWVTRDQHPIGIAPSEADTADLKAKGLPIEPLDGDWFEENSYLTSGFGTVVVPSRAPHPNAVKVYLNWLLSQEGQTQWTRAQGYPSRRVDAPTHHVRPGVVPKPGYPYFKSYDEQSVHTKEEISQFLRGEIRD
jgi:iron(III) transport system substrate-binding protein